MSTADMRIIHNWTHRGGESSELATHHLSLFKRRWGTFNTFPPDHRKTTVNITKRKRVKWQQKHVHQPPEMRKIPQQVIGASLEEMVQRVLSRPEIILQLWLNQTSEKEDSNRIRCYQGWWTTKIKMETCSCETTDGMQRRWDERCCAESHHKKVNSYNSTKKRSKIVPIGSEWSWYSYWKRFIETARWNNPSIKTGKIKMQRLIMLNYRRLLV